MRTLAKNKQSMKYALQIGAIPIYEQDTDGNVIYYKDTDGNKIPLETGNKEIAYSEPKNFKANITMSGGEAEAREYGLSIADYEAVISYSKGALPLVEGALIWFGSNVKYKNNGELIEVETKNGKQMLKVPENVSADYKVLKISSSLNEEKAILKAVNK